MRCIIAHMFYSKIVADGFAANDSQKCRFKNKEARVSSPNVSFSLFTGSVSSAILVSRLFKLPDPRSHGSNNPGATNVYRLGGKVTCCIVLVFDILKGTIPVWGAYFLK